MVWISVILSQQFVSPFIRCYKKSASKISLVSTVIAKATTKLDTETFRHPTLSEEQQKNGCRLGLDSWADTSCSGKHAFVDEFILGKSVTATGFTSSLGSMKNLPLANVLYAYDTNRGTTLLLEHSNTIYLGNDMEDSLANPIQSEECGNRVDLRPKVFYPGEDGAQTVTLSNGEIIPIKFDGVLPYIPVRRPSPEEIDSCERVQLTSKYEWDPFLQGNFSHLASNGETDLFSAMDTIDLSDPLSCSLMSATLANVLSIEQLLHSDQSHYDSEIKFQRSSSESKSFATINALNSKKEDSLTPEELSRRWGIGLRKATTHKYIRTTGLLTKRFRTDKAQLRYKQLSRQYGTFYVDYLKVGVTSIRQFIGGTLYTNKLGFKKFFPCTNETSKETGHSLRMFIEFVGLPFSLHSDNHSNFKEGLFKRLLRKFGVYSSYTEPHSPWQNRAEPAIGEVKTYSRKIMQKTQTPI